MRVLFLASAMCAMIAGVALAQSTLGDGANQGRQHTPGQPDAPPAARNHTPPTPPPPPIPRCADLAIASYAYVDTVPGGATLAADEVAIQYEVRNGGTAPYTTSTSGETALVLEYQTPGGIHQVASLGLPQAAGGHVAGGGATLAPQSSWQGYMRVTLTPADRRWPLKLKVDYSGGAVGLRGFANDCNTDNNEITLARRQ